MKRMMLIGERGAGKRAVIRALASETFIPRGNMSVEYCGPFVITPGEFLENRRFYCALIAIAGECDILAFVQNAAREGSLLPPRFAAMFNRTVVGIITHMDAAVANRERAERFLRNAGVRDCILLEEKHGVGVEEIRRLLVGNGGKGVSQEERA